MCIANIAFVVIRSEQVILPVFDLYNLKFLCLILPQLESKTFLYLIWPLRSNDACISWVTVIDKSLNKL